MILSPNQLWKDYDRKKVPLAVSVLSSAETDTAFLSYLYFNGDKTIDGVVRIFCKLYKPKGFAISDSAVIVFNDPEKTVDEFDPAAYLDRGMAVLVVDYAGERQDKSRFTLYPQSAVYANFFQNPNVFGIGDDTANPVRSCWYIWATNALRAVTYLESEAYKNIFILGYGYGGSQVWKTVYFEDAVKAGAVVFSTPHSEELTLSYRASLSSSQYALHAKSPVFVQTTSNEPNNTLDMMSDLYATSRDKGSLFSICERASRIIEPSRVKNIALWFSSHFRGEPIPKAPVLTANASENRLYWNLSVPPSGDIAKTELFVAHAVSNSSFRNWRGYELQSVGEGEYISRVPVLIADKPVYAFANVTYKNNFCISSVVEKVIPASLGIPPQNIQLKRLIYDNSMGLSDWQISYGAGEKQAELSVKKGPFDLEGIQSSSGKLITFRLADPQFVGNPDSALQITLFSFRRQEISFRICGTEKLLDFVAKRELSGDAAWTKISLSPSDFRGLGTGLSKWSDVLTFEILGSSPVLINSMLWV